MNDYLNCTDVVLSEISEALRLVSCEDAEEFVEMICSAKKVFVIGVGRVLLMLQAFVKRLNHLGITAYYVGAVEEPAITPDDILIVASGSGESAIPLVITEIAKKHNAKVIHIGASENSPIGRTVDRFIRIPSRTKSNRKGEIQSMQPMTSLFEQSLLLFCDIVALMIIRKNNLDINELWQYHANLE